MTTKDIPEILRSFSERPSSSRGPKTLFLDLKLYEELRAYCEDINKESKKHNKTATRTEQRRMVKPSDVIERLVARFLDNEIGL